MFADMAGRARSTGTGYDAFKEFGGKRYTGMKVGRGHKWRYEPGEWTEKKVTPDKWEFRYAVGKRRAGRAPEGSGAPVGTSHHWYILADQVVTKLDANSYSTDMTGVKFKVAHKRADKDAWSASERARRKRVVAILKQMIAELEKTPETAAPAAPQQPQTIDANGRGRHEGRDERNMAKSTSKRQQRAARTNIKKAAAAARRKKTISRLPKRVRTALGKEGAKRDGAGRAGLRPRPAGRAQHRAPRHDAPRQDDARRHARAERLRCEARPRSCRLALTRADPPTRRSEGSSRI
jgi:hypothetical protein